MSLRDAKPSKQTITCLGMQKIPGKVSIVVGVVLEDSQA